MRIHYAAACAALLALAACGDQNPAEEAQAETAAAADMAEAPKAETPAPQAAAEARPAAAPSDHPLVQPASADWTTNGGSLFNQRYSTLDRINRNNIGELGAVWRTSLNGSAMRPGFSGQAEPLVVDGVIYVVTGEDDVFAVSVETGEILWEHDSGIDFDQTALCCGWLSRGLGMGEGRLYVGQVDGRVLALDQQTGAVLWDIVGGDYNESYGITGAPRYYDGMVIVGYTGGDFGARGKVDAFDAETGELVWRFYTIPGPGEFGHDTWPQDNDAWKYGGAPVWQTPAIDPDLGMIYFSTGNAGPDMNGAIRAGDNLFTVSIVALDVHTGEYKWHFQQVRHDIWDFDSSNPVILFDAMIDGELRHGLAEASKSGYLFILDRTDGSPLTPIVDMPVPQNEISKTAATQPIPQGDPLAPHTLDAVGEDYVGILPHWGHTFTPFDGETPGVHKTVLVNWQPSSYDPDSHLMYLCVTEGAGASFGGDPDAKVGPPPRQAYLQGGGARVAGLPNVRRTLLVAMDLTDHSARWRRVMDGGCSGSITTAGGLIFLGRSNGVMSAMDSETGQRLWSWQTDAGVDATAATFEHEGEQYVAILSAGSTFGGELGDGLFLFALGGDMEQFTPEDAQRGGGSPFGPFGQPPAVPTDRVADLDSGESIYRTVCATCHGEDGSGGGHDISGIIPADIDIQSIMTIASNGVAGTEMPAFRGAYDAGQFHDVATYIHDVILPRRADHPANQ